MLDTRLVVRMAVPNAEERLMEYAGRWPLLGKTCTLYLDDAPVELRNENNKNGENSVICLDPEITDVPFAEVRFYEWDGTLAPDSLVEEMEDKNNISWFAVADSALEQNPRHAILLKVSIERHICSTGFISGDGMSAQTGARCGRTSSLTVTTSSLPSAAYCQFPIS